jgi:mono/diheme cytochrome c family protein
MKTLKIAVILSVIGVFLLACAQTPPVTNTTSNSTKEPANAAKGNASANTGGNSNVNAANIANTNANAGVDEFASARVIYKESCVKCHSENGEGGRVEPEDGKKPFKVPSFKSDNAKLMEDAEMIEYIRDGDGNMPSFKDKLKADQMKEMVKFIRKEFQGK